MIKAETEGVMTNESQPPPPVPPPATPPVSDAEALWRTERPEELKFWARWLDSPSCAERIHSSGVFPGHLARYLDPARSNYAVLDVGSGPISTIGPLLPGKVVNLFLTDPLAKGYSALLDQRGIFDTVRPIDVPGEVLTRVFPDKFFDLALCNNALDHAYDPLRIIRQMLQVCRSGGWVHVAGAFNVGVYENYHGLHQWNLELRGDRFFAWTPSEDHDVFAEIDGIGEIEVETLNPGGHPQFWVRMRKL